MSNKILSRTFQGLFSLVNKVMKHREPEVVAGPDAILLIPEILQKAGVKKPMLVSGPRVGRSEAVSKLMEQLSSAILYSEVNPDPHTSQIAEMAELYSRSGCDGIVAIGGGSNMDAAKAMGALVARPGKSLSQLGGVMRVRRELPFFVAVPTTAGTGSECTLAAVVTDDAQGRKYAVNDPVLCPDVAVLDANLTLSLPPNLTAYTGMDALTHAVEAYLNRPYHISNTKKLCEDAVREIFAYLPKAVKDGGDIEAREKMLKASFDAGKAFTVACVGYVHAMAHPFGGLYGIQHGLANAVILPYVLEAYRPVCDKPLARLCDVAGIRCGGGDGDKAAAFIAGIRQMNADFGIPTKLSVLKEEDVDKMCAWADRESNPLYPCPVYFDRRKFAEIIAQAG